MAPLRKTRHRGTCRVAGDILLNIIAYNLVRIPKPDLMVAPGEHYPLSQRMTRNAIHNGFLNQHQARRRKHKTRFIVTSPIKGWDRFARICATTSTMSATRKLAIPAR